MINARYDFCNIVGNQYICALEDEPSTVWGDKGNINGYSNFRISDDGGMFS